MAAPLAVVDLARRDTVVVRFLPATLALAAQAVAGAHQVIQACVVVWDCFKNLAIVIVMVIASDDCYFTPLYK